MAPRLRSTPDRRSAASAILRCGFEVLRRVHAPTDRRGRHVELYRRRSQGDRDHRGKLPAGDPGAGRGRPGRSDPENLAPHIFGDGIALVFDLPKYGDGGCLARMAELLDRIAVDRARLQRMSVVVTGSNGKGSTAAFSAGIARAYGLRTGLFTSPHLYRVNERFQVDGAPVGDDDLARLVSRVEVAIPEISQRKGVTFGAFGGMSALACLYFQEHEGDFAVF